MTGCDDGKVKIWHLASSECLKTLGEHSGAIEYVLVARARNELISTSWDSTVKIWDTRTYDCLKTLHGHTNWVRCLIKINKAGLVVTSSGDSLIKGMFIFFNGIKKKRI